MRHGATSPGPREAVRRVSGPVPTGRAGSVGAMTTEVGRAARITVATGIAVADPVATMAAAAVPVAGTTIDPEVATRAAMIDAPEAVTRAGTIIGPAADPVAAMIVGTAGAGETAPVEIAVTSVRATTEAVRAAGTARVLTRPATAEARSRRAMTGARTLGRAPSPANRRSPTTSIRKSSTVPSAATC